MKRVFVSTGFAGRDPDEIKKDYYKVIHDLCERLSEIIYITNGHSPDYPYNVYDSTIPWSLEVSQFSSCIHDMAFSDLAYFCKGWENYRGCQIEHQIAKSYGIPIYYE